MWPWHCISLWFFHHLSSFQTHSLLNFTFACSSDFVDSGSYLGLFKSPPYEEFWYVVCECQYYLLYYIVVELPLYFPITYSGFLAICEALLSNFLWFLNVNRLTLLASLFHNLFSFWWVTYLLGKSEVNTLSIINSCSHELP